MATAFIQSHPETIRFPLMERPLIGFLLALMAGSTNAWTLAHAGTFSTVQSGNIVQIGYRLAQNDWPAFWFAFWSVIAFGLGSAVCGVVMTSFLRHRRVYTRYILFFEFVALVALAWAASVGLIRPHYVAYGVSFVAGAQGNAFHKEHGMLYGNVAVTFVVQMAFNFLAQAMFKKEGINGEPNLMWSGLFFSVLFGFTLGGCVGFVVDRLVFDSSSLILAALIALAIWLCALASVKDADPTPGGMMA